MRLIKINSNYKRKIKVVITFLAVFNSFCFGQANFAHFYSAPLLYNPATTGRFNKSVRAGGSFQREIIVPNQTTTSSSVFADVKILTSRIKESEALAIGFVGLAENSNNGGMKNTYFSASFAYQKDLNAEGTQQIGIGFQSTIARRTLEKPNYFFEDQIATWANAGFLNIDASQFRTLDFSYLDLNVGLIYQGSINENNLFSIGTTLHHISKPNKVFEGVEFSLPQEIGGHISFEKRYASNKRLYAAILSNMYDDSLNDLITGFNYQFSINKSNFMNVGMWVRRSKFKGASLLPTIGLNFKNLVFNVSYSVGLPSKIIRKVETSEVSLKYNTSKSRAKFSETKFILF